MKYPLCFSYRKNGNLFTWSVFSVDELDQKIAENPSFELVSDRNEFVKLFESQKD